jgi:hypothetical protein
MGAGRFPQEFSRFLGDLTSFGRTIDTHKPHKYRSPDAITRPGLESVE